MPPGKPCIVRLHSIEALQTRYPAQVDWARVTRLVVVAEDINDVLLTGFPAIAGAVPVQVISNGIDMARFRLGTPDRFRVGWVGHLEPKKNPMLLMQIAHRVFHRDPRFSFHVAGSFTDLRTARYLKQMQSALGLAGVVHFDGPVTDMPGWYADKGVLLSTSMYESFGMNIGEAMAAGAFPVVHGFPGATGCGRRNACSSRWTRVKAGQDSARVTTSGTSRYGSFLRQNPSSPRAFTSSNALRHSVAPSVRDRWLKPRSRWSYWARSSP